MAIHDSIRDKIDHFFETAKRGYDDTYWIFMVIAAGAVITKLFGIGGFAAVVLAFVGMYILGLLTIKHEKRRSRKHAKAHEN